MSFPIEIVNKIIRFWIEFKRYDLHIEFNKICKIKCDKSFSYYYHFPDLQLFYMYYFIFKKKITTDVFPDVYHITRYLKYNKYRLDQKVIQKYQNFIYNLTDDFVIIELLRY